MAVDERLTAVNEKEKVALSDNEKLYSGQADDVFNQYQSLADKTLKNAEEQKKIQQQQSDLAIKKLESEQADSKKDYIKEQSGAYVDWQKQSNRYGANAEQMAASGMANTGYSESSQVAMYNAYQNRIAVAREAFTRADTAYNIAMEEARLQNNSILAEIAAKANEDALNYILQGTLYKNQLLTEKADKALQIKSFYSGEYQKALDQINNEKNYALNERQVKIQEEQWALEKAQLEAAILKQKEDEENKTPQGNTTYSRNSYNKKLAVDEAKIQNQEKKQSAQKKPSEAYRPLIDSITTYSGAIDFLKPRGLKPNEQLLAPLEWRKAKKEGDLGSEFNGISTYEEYLNVYLSWVVDNYM